MGGAVGLVVAVWPNSAQAVPFELAWSAPAGCPSREEVVVATHADLGEPRTEAPPELFVKGAVLPTKGGFVVTLALEDAAGVAVGEREVRVERGSCQEILKPTSVVLAMMIAVARPPVEVRDGSKDPAATPSAARSVSPPPDANPEPRAVPPPAASPSPLAPARNRLSVGAAGVGSTGILPEVGLGFGLHAYFLPRSILLLGLEASYEVGGSLRAAGGEVGFQLFSGGIRLGVPVLRKGPLELIPTLGAGIALIRTVPIGYAAVQNDLRATTFVGPGALLRIELIRSLAAEVLVEVHHLFVRDRFQVDDGTRLDRIHRPSAFEGRMSLGLAYELR